MYLVFVFIFTNVAYYNDTIDYMIIVCKSFLGMIFILVYTIFNQKYIYSECSLSNHKKLKMKKNGGKY